MSARERVWHVMSVTVSTSPSWTLEDGLVCATETGVWCVSANGQNRKPNGYPVNGSIGGTGSVPRGQCALFFACVE